jgi:hypothetical protein
MAKLTFDAAALRPIVEWTVSHAPHVLTYGQQLDPQFLKPGVTLKAGEWPKPEQLALESVPAALHWVKDDGIYLLSSSAERDIVDGTSSRVVYAQGYDPRTDADVWEKARAVVGGDDFVEALPIEWFTPLLTDESIVTVTLVVTSKDVRVTYQRRRRGNAH